VDKDISSSRVEKNRARIAYKEDEIPPHEKWLAAFVDELTGSADGTVLVRQFYAPGFYEAYDIVASYAQKSQLRVLWFQEKRRCGTPYSSTNYAELESQCTYCNNFFNDRDDIPCSATHCSAMFCSRKCFDEHNNLKHHGTVIS
jgi:hypothetical protein